MDGVEFVKVVFAKSTFSGVGTAPTSEAGVTRDRSRRDAAKSVTVENVNMLDRSPTQRYDRQRRVLNVMARDMCSVDRHRYQNRRDIRTRCRKIKSRRFWKSVECVEKVEKVENVENVAEAGGQGRPKGRTSLCTV